VVYTFDSSVIFGTHVNRWVRREENGRRPCSPGSCMHLCTYTVHASCGVYTGCMAHYKTSP